VIISFANQFFLFIFALYYFIMNDNIEVFLECLDTKINEAKSLIGEVNLWVN